MPTYSLESRFRSRGRADTLSTSGQTPSSSEPSSLLDLLKLLGVVHPELPEHIDLRVPIRHLRTGETLFHEGAAPESVYFVRSGTFKTFHIEVDGYEQVLGFAGRREVLGFDALALPTHPSAAISLEVSTVYAVAFRDLFTLGTVAPCFERVIFTAVSMALNKQVELAGVMSAAASEVRLARFLLNVSRRMAAVGESGRRLRLRMCRRDIASHLGVAPETISRSFQALADAGLLHVKDREVELCNLDAMTRFAQGTRRQGTASTRIGSTVSANGME